MLGLIALLVWYWKGTGGPFCYYKIQAYGGYGRSFNLLSGIWHHRPQWDAPLFYLYLSLWGSIQLIKKPDLLSRMLGFFSLAFTEVPLFFGGFFGMFIFLTEQAERSKLKEILITVFFLSKLAV